MWSGDPNWPNHIRQTVDDKSRVVALARQWWRSIDGLAQYGKVPVQRAISGLNGARAAPVLVFHFNVDEREVRRVEEDSLCFRTALHSMRKLLSAY